MNALEELILSLVEESEDGCWLWKGSTSANGYGIFSLPAHRAVYLLKKAAIPPMKHLDHLCRVHNCVNPDHLEPVSRKENLLRGEGFGAKNARKTHCLRGHEYTPQNTGYFKSGGRYCKTCKRTAGLLWARANAEKTGIYGSGAYNSAKTHCKNGHEYTPENTYTWRGRRHCVLCNRQAAARHRAKKSA